MKSKKLRVIAGILALFLYEVGCADNAANAAVPSDQQTDSQQPSDSVDWPKTLTVDGQEMTLYQPQVEKYEGNNLTFMMAVGVGAGEQVSYGTVSAQCVTDVNQADNTASCESVQINNTDFPDTQDQEKLTQLVNKTLGQQPLTISVDALEASLKLSQINQLKSKNTQFQSTPPQIFVADTPTVLVLIDGDPQLRQVDNSPGLMRVINSAFVIILDSQSGIYYLQAGNRWMQAGQIEGPWAEAKTVPSAIQSLETDPKSYSKSKEDQQTFATAPAIIISTSPAALIQTDGKPEFTPIQGTQLMSVSNTDGDVFLQIKSQDYFVLLSGRWYKSNQLTPKSTWDYLPADQLPEDFAKIPESSSKANVLASIPSSSVAQEAVIRNQIPQTAKVKRSTASATVTYDGNPQFKKISGTAMQYATNTASSVIMLNNQYYVVQQGVWFVSSSATGPWTILTQVPDEIYTIPPTVPVYPVTYTYVYNATPDYVYVGYTGGYLNSYIDNGVVVYGTGYVYPSWVGTVYYGAPITYGFNFGYGLAVGYWTARVIYDSPRWYGGGLRIGGYAYGPVGWHAGWFGPASGAVFVNRHTINNFNRTTVNINTHNVYNRWGSNVVVNKWNQGNKNQLQKFNNNFPNAANRNLSANQKQSIKNKANANLSNTQKQNLSNKVNGKLSDTQKQNLSNKANGKLSDTQKQNLSNKANGKLSDTQKQNLSNKANTKLTKDQMSNLKAKGASQKAAGQSVPKKNNVYTGQDKKAYQHNPNSGWQSHNNKSNQWKPVKPNQVPSNVKSAHQQRSRGAQIQQRQSIQPSGGRRAGGGGGGGGGHRR